MGAVDHPLLLRRHRFSVADCHRMAEVGLLAPDARVELIEGEVIDLPPIGTRHGSAVERLLTLLVHAAGERGIVRLHRKPHGDEYAETQVAATPGVTPIALLPGATIDLSNVLV